MKTLSLSFALWALEGEGSCGTTGYGRITAQIWHNNKWVLSNVACDNCGPKPAAKNGECWSCAMTGGNVGKYHCGYFCGNTPCPMFTGGCSPNPFFQDIVGTYAVANYVHFSVAGLYGRYTGCGNTPCYEGDLTKNSQGIWPKVGVGTCWTGTKCYKYACAHSSGNLMCGNSICEEMKAKCSDHSCSGVYVDKSNAPTRCSDSTCSDDECCQERAKCSYHSCSGAYVDKSNAPTRCSDSRVQMMNVARQQEGAALHHVLLVM